MKCQTIILFITCLVIYAAVVEGCGRSRRRKRRPPVNRPPSISCPSASDKTAGSLQRAHAVSWGNPSSSDDHGVTRIKRKGQESGSSFSEGAHSVTYVAYDRSGLTASCSFSFRIHVVRCARLTSPSNGRMSCDSHDQVYGTTCSFKCDDGYRLEGSSSSNCQRTGLNSHSVPSCKKIVCPTPHKPSHALNIYCTDGHYYQSLCYLKCDEENGYTPRHSNYGQCTSSKKWNFQKWSCEDTRKPVILNCPEGELKTSDPKYEWPKIGAIDNSGQVTLTQIQGSPPGSTLNMLVGTYLIRYTAVDPSGNIAPLCIFSVTYTKPACGKPPSGHADNNPEFRCNAGYTVGSSCQANCSFSAVVGAKYIQCVREKGVVPVSTWVGFKGDYPKCYKKSCPNLRAPTNGVLVCDKFFGGETCQMFCNMDYDVPDSLKSLTTYICGSSGIWKPIKNTIDCTEMAFPDVYNLPSELYYFSGNCSDEVTNSEIRQMFLDNLAEAGVHECQGRECSIEMVDITCGPVDVDEAEDYYYYEYDDEDEDGNMIDVDVVDEDIDGEDDKTEMNESDHSEFSNPKLPILSRRRRAIFAPDVDRVLSRLRNSTQKFTLPPEGSGNVRIRRRKIPVSKTTIRFNWVVKNVSRSLSAEDIELFQAAVSGNTVLTSNATRKFRLQSTSLLNFTCAPGSVISNSSLDLCVSCPAGTFHNVVTDTCEPCTRNYYTTTVGQSSCISCKHHTGTRSSMTSSPRDCIEMCSPGYFSTDGLIPCAPCSLGTYQASFVSTGCMTCPSGSSTADMGSTHMDNCTAYDVLAKGPVVLNIGSVLDDWTEDLTMAFWIRTFPPIGGTANVTFVLNHPVRGHQMTLDLNRNQSSISMRDISINVHAPLVQDEWMHVAVVWKGFPSFVDNYREGKRVNRYSNHTPLCFVPKGTQLKIIIGPNSSITLRELYVLPISNSSQLLSKMGRSCGSVDIGSESLVGRIESTEPSKLSMVVPSVCSEIDRCKPHPCPGHQCKSFKHAFECTCAGGYSGPTCSIPPDYCLVNNRCQNDAACENGEAGVVCTCIEDYKGQYCQTPIVNGNWNDWSQWTECTLTCNGGERSRTRKCDNPAPEAELGRSCYGAPKETSVCNLHPCPECLDSQLTLGHGVDILCNHTSLGSAVCSTSCQQGLVFSQDPPDYNCVDAVWYPASKTVSCVEVNIPKTVSFQYTVPYKIRVDDDEEEHVAVIRKTVLACGRNTTCVLNEDCQVTATVEICRSSGQCKEFPEGYRATLTFTGDVRISNDGTAAASQKLLEDAWEKLNVTNNDLDEMFEECFLVVLSTGTVNPGTATQDMDLTCQVGSVPDQGYCSACAPGTRWSNSTCLECDVGWYQAHSGELVCDMCPTAYFTQYLGSSLGQECLAPPADSFMLLTDPVKGNIWKLNLTDFKPEVVSLPDNARIGSSAYDPITNHIFYVDKAHPAIHSVGRTNSKTYLRLNWAASVDGITIDPVSRLIFYTDKGNDVIGVVTMVTKHHRVVIRAGTYMPRNVAVDPSKGLLYWIDWGQDQRIEQANYDGTARTVLIASRTIWPEGMALDLQSNTLYWSDGSTRTINSLHLQEGNESIVYTSPENYPTALSLTHSYIFYAAITPNESSIIMRINKDGSGNGQTELPDYKYVSDLHTHRRSDYSQVTNGCSRNNGGCSHICFPRPDGKRTCTCPDGYTTDIETEDCIKNPRRWWQVWMQPRGRMLRHQFKPRTWDP